MKINFDTADFFSEYEIELSEAEIENPKKSLTEFTFGLAKLFIDFSRTVGFDVEKAGTVFDICIDPIKDHINNLLEILSSEEEEETETETEIEHLVEELQATGRFSDDEVKAVVQFAREAGSVEAAKNSLLDGIFNSNKENINVDDVDSEEKPPII